MFWERKRGSNSGGQAETNLVKPSDNDLINANFTLSEILATDKIVEVYVKERLRQLYSGVFNPLPSLNFKINWEKVNAETSDREVVSANDDSKEVSQPWYSKKVWRIAAASVNTAGLLGGAVAVDQIIERDSRVFAEPVPAIHTELVGESTDLQTEQQEPQSLQNDTNEVENLKEAVSRLTAGDYKELAETIFQGNSGSVANRDLVYPGQILAVNDEFKAILGSKGVKADIGQIMIEKGNGISQQIKADLERQAENKAADQASHEKENLQSADDSGNGGEVKGSDEIREDGNRNNDSGKLKNLENEPTPSPSAVPSNTVQPSRAPTATPLPLASLTPSPSPTFSSTPASSPSPAPKPSSTPAAISSPTASPTREATISPTAISTPCPLLPSPAATPEGCPTPPPCPSSAEKLPIDCPAPSPSPTPEPTVSPRPSPTPGPSPSPEPSPAPTATVEACIATDVKGELNDLPGQLHFSNNPVRGVVSNIAKNAACSDDIYIHVYGSVQYPETPGWIESQRGNHIETKKIVVREGAVDEPFEYPVPNRDFCWYQVDLTRDGEIKNEPRYITNDYVFVKDIDSCLPPVPVVSVTPPPPDAEPGPPTGKTPTATPRPTIEAPRPTATVTATPKPAEPTAIPTASPTPEPPMIAIPTPVVPVPGITGMLGLADKSNRERLFVSRRDEKPNFFPLFAGAASLAFAAFVFSKSQERRRKLYKKWNFNELDDEDETESTADTNL